MTKQKIRTLFPLNTILSNHLCCIFNFLKQVIDSPDIFLILTYNDNILTNCRSLLKIDHFLCLVSIYQFIVNVNHFENLLVNETMWPKIWTTTKKTSFMLLPKLAFTLCVKIKDYFDILQGSFRKYNLWNEDLP